MENSYISPRYTRRRDRFAMFALGALVYPAAEMLWRGYSHWTMSIAGGLCTLFIHLCNRRMHRRGLLARCGAGCAIITSVEFAAGCVVNRLLGWNVWDYSGTPLNVMGQVCLLYSVLWFFLTLPVLAASSWLEHRHSRTDIVFE